MKYSASKVGYLMQNTNMEPGTSPLEDHPNYIGTVQPMTDYPKLSGTLFGY